MRSILDKILDLILNLISCNRNSKQSQTTTSLPRNSIEDANSRDRPQKKSEKGRSITRQTTRHKLNSKFLLYRDDLAKGATIPCTHALTGSQFHEKDLS